MGNRRKAREFTLQFLFQRDFQPAGQKCNSLETELELFRHSFDTSKKALSYSTFLISGIGERLSEIDELLVKHSHNWRIDRMSVLDRNILRIAVFELCFSDDIPARVAINEAVEIAKRFGTGDSTAFINGILDAIKSSLPDKP